MDEDKVLCVHCLKNVDAKTHVDCTVNFDNFLDTQERGGTEHVQQNIGETSVQRQQMSYPSIQVLQSGNENNLLEIKPDYVNPETLNVHTTKEISSNRNSTSPRILGPYNHGVQRPEFTEYRNSRHKDNRILYEPAQVYNPDNPLHPHATYIGKKIGQTAFGSIQRENEFPNAMTQNNERNRLYYENPQCSYNQNFLRNTFQPPTLMDFGATFPNPISNKRMRVFGHMDQPPHFNYPQPQNRHLSYEPQVSIMHPNHNLELVSENLKNSPSGPEHAVASNHATWHKVTVNKEMDFLRQNELPLPCLVSKTEMPNVNKDELDTVHNRYGEIYPQSTQQKNSERSTPQKNVKSSAHQEIEMRSTPQKNVEKIVHQKNEGMMQSSAKHAERSVQEKIAEKRVQQNDADQIVQQKDADQSVQQKDADQSVQQKDADQSVQQKDADQSVQQKDADQSVQQKDDVEQSLQQKDVEQSVQGKDEEKSAKENAGRFTGEGYKSIDEFIKALYNGTLYRRY